ncbi:charged multivesicular body protein 7 isoform X2 [Carica papaya]|uniref:charged multivesicular body protein 7 isoform X2 n=1 Tax=Carica papaya TaxID=3649 RepID=UPI000B8CA8D5|nr:charged multivesicular body protein 7 isoform X2 [Carica papaya]
MDLSSIKEYLKEVPDWDDEVMATARFKAFSGQRLDWEPKFRFWRDLILNICRHFGLFIVQPSQVKNIWFNRGGLVPLCIEDVLVVMYNEGDIIRIGDLEDPTRTRFSQLLSKVRNLVVRTRMAPELILEDRVIIAPLLKGIKVSLTPAAVPSISSLDCDVLHLIWTTEKLQEQLDLIDQRYQGSRKSALTSLKSGNKKLALRYAKEMKLGNESREKYTSLLNRVEEVLNVIADAESTKKLSEAIQIGGRIMKENQISFEEVQVCLDKLEEIIDSQKQVEKALGSTPSYADIEDEDIEDEFNKLELELESEKSQVQAAGKAASSKSAESLSNILSNLRLADGPGVASEILETVARGRKDESKSSILEPA